MLVTGASASLFGMCRASTGPHAVVVSEFILFGKRFLEEFQEVERVAGYEDFGVGLSDEREVPLYVVVEVYVFEEVVVVVRMRMVGKTVEGCGSGTKRKFVDEHFAVFEYLVVAQHICREARTMGADIQVEVPDDDGGNSSSWKNNLEDKNT